VSKFGPWTLFLLIPAFTGCALIGGLAGAALPYAGVKMMLACVPEGTLVDAPAGPRPIEQLEPGDQVIGFGGRPVRILQKHSYLEEPTTEFVQLRFAQGAAVQVCKMHRVAGIRAGEVQIGQILAGQEVIAIETHRGETRSYDLLTEDAGYQINGVPVNSMIEEMSRAAAFGLRAVNR
jgi:hypothetical protein